MKTRSTFTGAGWDFSEVWCMVEKVTYPFLRWQDTESPRADAGPDQTNDEGSTVTFNGSASTDDCGIGNYTWSFSDKAPVELYGIRPAYIFDDPGVFNVTLTVTDALGRLGADSMIVTVGDETDPVPVAGPDQTVDEGSVVAFNGSGSLDNVGIINYTWSFMDPAPVELYGLVATYRFENPGTFPVSLKATDAAGNWAADTLTVTVNDITSPVADAGPDRVVGVGEVLTFNGSASTDNVGIVKYGWTFADGGLVVLSGAKPSHTFKNPGTFLVTLNVTDAAGLWGTDTMTVSVNDTTAPVANAGPDRTVDETVEAVFNGSGSSDNVGVVNFIWNFEDGTAVTLQGMTCQYKFSRPGTFVVTLRVFDAAGNWAEDNMTVTVNDRTPPVANAGPDITVGEGTTVVFNGSGSSDNVGIVRFSWTFSYNNGPVILTGASPSYTFVIPGVYPVKLNVSDASGFSSVDAMVLLVRDTKPPVAEAGPDQKVAAGTMVVFSGSHSTDNWGIELYFWNFTYDGKPQSLGNETNFFRFDKEGVYEIVLTVVDRDGNRAEDRFTVTVTPAGNVFGIAPPVMTLIVLAIIAVAAVCVLAFLKMRKKRSGGAEIN
jgi:PKD repeat protein